MYKIIILLLLSQHILTTIHAQNSDTLYFKKVNRIVGSTDFETILSGAGYLYASSNYFNLLYENELQNRLSLLYGIEYQKLVSKVIINGKLSSVFVSHFYFLKTKSHYYFLPFNKQKHSRLNGLYIGPSFKIGASITDNYRYYRLSPGILIGSCFVVSNRFTLNVEFDFDGYLDWSKKLDRDDEYYYSSGVWMNLWFSVGYRF